jgi:hypothetical protein
MCTSIVNHLVPSGNVTETQDTEFLYSFFVLDSEQSIRHSNLHLLSGVDEVTWEQSQLVTAIHD